MAVMFEVFEVEATMSQLSEGGGGGSDEGRVCLEVEEGREGGRRGWSRRKMGGDGWWRGDGQRQVRASAEDAVTRGR